MILKKAAALEKVVHRQVVDYIKIQYPKVIFHTDFAAGNKMTIGQAIQNSKLQSDKGFPDLFIPYPKNCYSGLFLEIKASREKVFKKDGSLKKDEHVEIQANMLARLTKLGYRAQFGCGFEHCKSIIDNYFN